MDSPDGGYGRRRGKREDREDPDEERALLRGGMTTSSLTNGGAHHSTHLHLKHLQNSSHNHHDPGAAAGIGGGGQEQDRRREGGDQGCTQGSGISSGGAAGDGRSMLQGVDLYMKSTKRFFNLYWSKIAKQQRERTRKMATTNAISVGDDVKEKKERASTNSSFSRSKSLMLMGREQPPPSSWETVPTATPTATSHILAENNSLELELRDMEEGVESRAVLQVEELEKDHETAPLLPTAETETGDGTGGREGGEGRPLRRSEQVMVTTGDLTKLVSDEHQGAGEASAQEDKDRDVLVKGNGSFGAKSTYRVSVRPSRSAALPVKQQHQPVVSKSKIDQWRREEWADRSFKVLGVEIGHLPESQQFLVCAGGVFSFLLVYGYMQEYLVVGIFQRELGLFLTLLQFFGYAACAAIQRGMHKQKERKIPIITYAGLGFLQACMQGLTNMSMVYLNYPAKVLFKSSRMVPIMCFGVVWQGRKYSKRDYMVVFLIVTGLATFMNAETRASETSETPFSLVGVGCISLALVIDAAIINIQEEIMNRYDSCQDELIMFSYLCGTVYLVIASLFTGDLQQGVLFLHHKGMKALLAVTLFASAGYLGVSCVAALTKRFGALHSAITTTARKALTLMLSFIVFPNKPFSTQHLIGAAVFVLGLVTKATGKKSSSNLQVTQAATSSPGTTPFIRSRGRKRLPAGRDSFDDSSSHSAAPLLSVTSGGGVSCKGGGGGDIDRSQSKSPDGAEGSANVVGHSGGYPVRHRGYPKNGNDATGTADRDSGMAAGRGGRWARARSPQGDRQIQRSPRRRMISPPVSGLGSRVPV